MFKHTVLTLSQNDQTLNSKLRLTVSSEAEYSPTMKWQNVSVVQ